MPMKKHKHDDNLLPELASIFDNNSFESINHRRDQLVVYHLVSRVNQVLERGVTNTASPKKNIQARGFDEVPIVLEALKDIQAGEEITVAYVHGLPYAKRQKTLESQWGFMCRCKLCLAEKEVLERLAKLKAVNEDGKRTGSHRSRIAKKHVICGPASRKR